MLAKSKKAIGVIVLLFLAGAALVTSVSTVGAQEYVEWETFAYIIVTPNPVGVNQRLIVQFRIDKTYPGGTLLGPFWQNFTVKITRPDGQVEEKKGLKADATGGSWFTYTPTMEGTYKFQTIFPGQWVNTTTPKRWYKPSQSKILEVTVQREEVPPYPDVPLPTDYWTRPIYGEIKGASQIADSWLMRGYDRTDRGFAGATAFAPYTSAPDSPHILWTKPLWFGGVGGGQFGDKMFYTGLSYEQPYEPMILCGRLIYTEYEPANRVALGTRCVDLYTGETIWYLNGTNILFAQIFDIENPNEHGLIAHLWSQSGSGLTATLTMYDGFTGRKILDIKNVTWGFAKFGPSGEILSYYLDNVRSRLILWNSSKAIFAAFPWIGGVQGAIYDPNVGATVDGRLGIQWNVSIPKTGFNRYIQAVGGGIVLVTAASVGMLPASLTVTYPQIYPHMAFPETLSLLPNGSYPNSITPLWYHNRTNIYGMFERLSRNIADGIYTMFDEATMKLHAYDINTGAEIWESQSFNTLGESPSDFAQFTRDYHIAYGKVFTAGFDGHVRAFDAKTGKLVWDYYFGSSGYETPYGTWPVYAGFTIADHKLYVTNDEHSPDAVEWRGGKLWCFDTENGTLLWSISGMFRMPVISDGYLTAENSYDGKIYVFGKGPSATTVSVSAKTVVKGSRILIEGSVTDLSPGQRGTPAVARESMAAWMEYLHMQKPVPAEVKGVPVELYAIYPDGSYKYIDTTVTNGFYGTFSHAWTPPEEGTYTIIAVFRGDESYGSSSAATGLLVTAAPPEPPTPATAEQAGTLQSIIESQQPLITALIVLVAIAIVIGVVNIVIIIKKMRK